MWPSLLAQWIHKKKRGVFTSHQVKRGNLTLIVSLSCHLLRFWIKSCMWKRLQNSSGECGEMGWRLNVVAWPSGGSAYGRVRVTHLKSVFQRSYLHIESVILISQSVYHHKFLILKSTKDNITCYIYITTRASCLSEGNIHNSNTHYIVSNRVWVLKLWCILNHFGSSMCMMAVICCVLDNYWCSPFPILNNKSVILCREEFGSNRVPFQIFKFSIVLGDYARSGENDDCAVHS